MPTTTKTSTRSRRFFAVRLGKDWVELRRSIRRIQGVKSTVYREVTAERLVRYQDGWLTPPGDAWYPHGIAKWAYKTVEELKKVPLTQTNWVGGVSLGVFQTGEVAGHLTLPRLSHAVELKPKAVRDFLKKHKHEHQEVA